MVREIKGLKCPNHDRIRDNHHFMYDAIPGCQPTAFTRCLRCGKWHSITFNLYMTRERESDEYIEFVE